MDYSQAEVTAIISDTGRRWRHTDFTGDHLCKWNQGVLIPLAPAPPPAARQLNSGSLHTATDLSVMTRSVTDISHAESVGASAGRIKIP